MAKEYKTHMIKLVLMDYWHGAPDEAVTWCGIRSGDCSEELFESGCFVENHRPEKTTCKNCLRSYHKDMARQRQADMVSLPIKSTNLSVNNNLN